MTISRTLYLIERRSHLYRLAPAEVDYLLAHYCTAIEVLPTDRRHVYRLTPAGVAGVIVTPRRRIVISSKVPLRNLLLLLDPADDPPAVRDTVRPSDGSEVIDLLAGQLALRMSERSSAGLHRAYRETTAQGAYLVGRLDVAEQLRQQSRGKEQIHSLHDEFTADVPCNRVPRSVATGLLASGLLGPAVRERLAAALLPFAHLEEISLTSDVLARLQRERVPVEYGPLLDLCRLLIDSLAPASSAGKVPAPAFLLPLEKLFERYVTRAVREAFADEDGVQVSPQETSHVGEPVVGQPEVHVRPDIRIQRAGATLLVLDAKWKNLPTRAVITEDFYQALAYCTVLGASRAVLVYPGRRRRIWEYTIGRKNARVEVRTLDVSGDAERCRRAQERLGRALRGMAAGPRAEHFPVEE
jgi:5-methylcytosine-specific restriction enzyme subunit McrC